MQIRTVLIGIAVVAVLLIIDMGIMLSIHFIAPRPTVEVPQTATLTIATTSTRTYSLTPAEVTDLSNPDGSLNMNRLRAYMASSSHL